MLLLMIEQGALNVAQDLQGEIEAIRLRDRCQQRIQMVRDPDTEVAQETELAEPFDRTQAHQQRYPAGIGSLILQI
jgi:hypothetical protein